MQPVDVTPVPIQGVSVLVQPGTNQINLQNTVRNPYMALGLLVVGIALLLKQILGESKPASGLVVANGPLPQG